MADHYARLLEATIQHLEALQARRVQFVPVSPETLTVLKQAAGRPRSVKPLARQMENPGASSPAPEIPAKVLAEKPASFQSPVPSSPAANVAKPIPQTELTPGTEIPATSLSSPSSNQQKTAAFADLRQRALACVKCPHLASTRKNVVFGVGDINAQLMFVGEAPGADEDTQGEPFVGRAGELLTKIIEAMGLKRTSVYIGNILKCRPDMPPDVAGNRKPTPEEMQTCIPFLHEQIDLIRPRALVGLGATAIEGLLGKTVGITKLRGNWQVYRGIPLMPTLHPAYILRNQALSVKRQVWEDMLKVMEKLALPISAKQQNYFLK